MFGVVISTMHFGRGLFWYSNFKFFDIDDKEETNLTARSSRGESLTITKDMQVLYLQTKQTEILLQLYQVFLLFIRSCCSRSEKTSVFLKNSSW